MYVLYVYQTEVMAAEMKTLEAQLGGLRENLENMRRHQFKAQVSSTALSLLPDGQDQPHWYLVVFNLFVLKGANPSFTFGEAATSTTNPRSSFGVVSGCSIHFGIVSAGLNEFNSPLERFLVFGALKWPFGSQAAQLEAMRADYKAQNSASSAEIASLSQHVAVTTGEINTLKEILDTLTADK